MLMIFLGIDTPELKTVPSNKHLVRLASLFGISTFGEFIIHLGLDVHEYKNIQNQYESNGVQSIMFMALAKWMKDIRAKLKRPYFKHIRDTLLEVNMDHHFLCQVMMCTYRASTVDVTSVLITRACLVRQSYITCKTLHQNLLSSKSKIKTQVDTIPSSR